MRIFHIIILLFLLSAFAIGVGLQDTDSNLIDSSIDNASLIIENISLDAPNSSEIPNIKGFYNVIESGTKFAGILGMETMRAGIYFGRDNPEYFTQDFIFKIAKLIVILTIVSLLIKPVFYILIFLVMGLMWIIDSFKNKKQRGKKCGKKI